MHSTQSPDSTGRLSAMTSKRVDMKMDIFKEDGQWHFILYGPRWILQDISKTMSDQIAPGVLVHANGPSITTGSDQSSMMFMTWGGGPIGSPPPSKSKRLIKLISLKKFLRRREKKS